MPYSMRDYRGVIHILRALLRFRWGVFAGNVYVFEIVWLLPKKNKIHFFNSYNQPKHKINYPG